MRNDAATPMMSSPSTVPSPLTSGTFGRPAVFPRWPRLTRPPLGQARSRDRSRDRRGRPSTRRCAAGTEASSAGSIETFPLVPVTSTIGALVRCREMFQKRVGVRSTGHRRRRGRAGRVRRSRSPQLFGDDRVRDRERGGAGRAERVGNDGVLQLDPARPDLGLVLHDRIERKRRSRRWPTRRSRRPTACRSASGLRPRSHRARRSRRRGCCERDRRVRRCCGAVAGRVVVRRGDQPRPPPCDGGIVALDRVPSISNRTAGRGRARAVQLREEASASDRRGVREIPRAVIADERISGRAGWRLGAAAAAGRSKPGGTARVRPPRLSGVGGQSFVDHVSAVCLPPSMGRMLSGSRRRSPRRRCSARNWGCPRFPG